MGKKIEERIENGIKHVEKVIGYFDNMKIKEKDAENIFKKSDKLLEDCIDIISKDKFYIKKFFLKQIKHIKKKD